MECATDYKQRAWMNVALRGGRDTLKSLLKARGVAGLDPQISKL